MIMRCDECGHKKPNANTCKLHKSGLPLTRTCRDWVALPEQCSTCTNFNRIMAECALTRESQKPDDTCGSWEPVPTKSEAVRRHSQLPEPPQAPPQPRQPPAADLAKVLAVFKGADGGLYWSRQGLMVHSTEPEVWVVKLSSGKCHVLGEVVEILDTAEALARIRSEALAKLTVQERKVLGLEKS